MMRARESLEPVILSKAKNLQPDPFPGSETAYKGMKP